MMKWEQILHPGRDHFHVLRLQTSDANSNEHFQQRSRSFWDANRAARFFLLQLAQTGKIYQITLKYTKKP
jgi:hypothetical protein